MILLVPIAFAFWIAAARYRRTFTGFGIGLGALLLLGGITWLHTKLGQWTDGRIQVDHFRVIMLPYTALVPAVAWYICALPRRTEHAACRICRYPLKDLAGQADRCPECGSRQPHALPVRYRPSGTPRTSYRTNDGPTPVDLRGRPMPSSASPHAVGPEQSVAVPQTPPPDTAGA